MPGYADLDAAKAQLELSDDDAGDEAAIAFLEALDEEIAALFDRKVSPTAVSPLFGGTAAAAARVVVGPPVAGQPILPLPVGLRSVTAVAITGGVAEALDAADYVLWLPSQNGGYAALRRIDGGYWPARDGRSTITVTGVWMDTAAGGSVPALVQSCCTFALVEEYRLRTSSPAGQIGSDGLAIRPRNPWKFTVCVEAVAAYKTALPVASF